MPAKYYPPVRNQDAFTCPYCGVYANQSFTPGLSGYISGHGVLKLDGSISQCARCQRMCIWVGEQLVYPDLGSAHEPTADMPEDVRTDYLEASSIASRSPRSAAALLRLAVQKLCISLGLPGKHLNDDIGVLVKTKGLSAQVQKALDVLRVIGNNAVHPGEINVDDSPEVVNALFGLLNFIVEQMITQPKQIEALYGILPDGVKAGVAKRDGTDIK